MHPRIFICSQIQIRWIACAHEFFWIIQLSAGKMAWIAFRTPLTRRNTKFCTLRVRGRIASSVFWVDDNVTAERPLFCRTYIYTARHADAISPATVPKPFSHALLNSISWCAAHLVSVKHALAKGNFSGSYFALIRDEIIKQPEFPPKFTNGSGNGSL